MLVKAADDEVKSFKAQPPCTRMMTAVITQLSTPFESWEETYNSWHMTVMEPVLHGTTAGGCGEMESESAPEGIAPCAIFANGVHLLHFAQTTSVSRDMCASTPLLTVPYPHAAEHKVGSIYNGTTLYRNRVYISANAIYALSSTWTTTIVDKSRTYWQCQRTTLGPVLSNTLIELRSSEISSLRMPYVDTQYPFSYAVCIISCLPFPESSNCSNRT
jgi:hypothetical protein